ncbi:hypothetical protein P4B35_10145 [Pontiellaceae bacterium B12227]|nr:hypothetical protein [Pontiellaceae bacterium B12227]
MGFLKRILDLLFVAPVAEERSRPTTPQQSPATEDEPPRSGHVGRKRTAFRKVGANDVISDSEESHCRRGNILQSDTLKTKAITASGKLAETDTLKSICSVCGEAEDAVIRSGTSHVVLCRTCMRKFKHPNGQIMVVTPKEYEELEKEYDTWKAFDSKRKRSYR